MTAPPALDLGPLISYVRGAELLPWTGEVVEVVGMLVASRGPAVAVGDFCEVSTSSGRRVRTQVIGFRNGHVLSMPLEEIDGIQLHDRIVARQDEARVAVGPGAHRTRPGRLWPRHRPGTQNQTRRAVPSLPAAGKPARPRAHHRSARHRHSGHRCAHPLRQRPAHRHLRRQRRRQEHPARLHGQTQLRRRDRHRFGRRAQPGSSRLSRTRYGARGPEAFHRGLRHLRPARPPARPRLLLWPSRSPSTFAIRAPMCCSSWTP